MSLIKNNVFHFHVQNSLEKLSDLIELVALQLNELCNCSLTTEYVAEGRLVCNPKQPGEVILQGRIISITGKNSTDLLIVLQGWVLGKPTIVVLGVQLKVDPECSVELEYLGDTKCSTNSVVVLSLVLPAVGGGIVATLVIVLLVVIVVKVCVKKKKMTNCSPSVGTDQAK